MIEFDEYFSIQVFFIILRETLETAIIISVLLSFINQRSTSSGETPDGPHHASTTEVNRKLKLQVWLGAILGLVICLIIGLVFIVGFYYIGQDYWSYTERLWEGVFSLLSSIIITIMGIGLLRINKIMKVKWWVKLGEAYNHQHCDDAEGEQEIAKLLGSDTESVQEPPSNDSRASVDSSQQLLRRSAKKTKKNGFTKKYYLAILPLITTLREGLEAVVFIGGIGMSSPPSSIPLSIISGVVVGSTVGYILYKGGNKLSLQYFLIMSTCFLYIVSAGLMSRGVWFLELEQFVRKCGGLDVSETGSGPGSYDISKSVWHVNCCNGLTDGWWMVLNAIVGWTNSATYGSVGSYIAYWLVVIIWLEAKLYDEKHGYFPVIPMKWQLKRIKKKLKLYEMRQSQSNQPLLPNNIEPSIDERIAEGEVLLA